MEKEAGMTCFMMMQMSCKVIKALSGNVDGAVPRGEDIRSCVLYLLMS